MGRSYGHIKMYENAIIELKKQGVTNREIGLKYGLTKEQIKDFVKRHNRNQRKVDAGIAIHKQGRPVKDRVVTEEMKSAELRYIIARKDAKIKQLEMENKLMRDFLSLTERK